MKRHWRNFCRTVRGIIAASLTFASVTPVAVADQERHALLIGINEYASPKVVDLRGAINDVKMLSRILETRFGFPAENITVLKNEQATRAGILAAIDEFIARVDADDTVYLHYSGHGSRTKDHNGDEEDGLDETILPHDARMPGIADIVDDELERRFAGIDSTNVLIVFDSCYAGTVTRDAALVQPRATLPDTREELYRDIATRAVVQVESLPHVLMTGAPDDKQALDGPVDEGFFGLFSYSLARSLESNGPEATAQEIHEGVKQELQRIREQLFTSPPEPQLEGPAERLRTAVLPLPRAAEKIAPSAPRRTWLDVTRLGSDDLLLVDGIQLNARPGSQWAIYPRDETRFDYGNALALGTVTQMRGSDAVLRVRFRRGAIPDDARAIAIAPPDPGTEVALVLRGIPEERALRLGASIEARATNARVVDTGGNARFVAELDQGIWNVLDAGGLQSILEFADAEDGIVTDRIAGVVTRTSRALSLLALDNLATSLRLDMKVSGSDGDYVIRRAGDPRTASNSLMLALRSSRDTYISIVDVDAQGGINLLFPNEYQNPDFLPDGLIRAGQTVRIPDSLAANNRAGFHWDISPPAGKDTIRVFASTNRDTARSIRDFIGGADAPDLRELRETLATRAARGVKVVADVPSDDWTAASITLDVKEDVRE